MKNKIIKIKIISSAWLIAIFMFAITSCNKGDLSPNTSTSGIPIQDKNSNSHCLMTHTEDDLFGYTLDIFYNAIGNPDSMVIDGYFPATMEYDNQDRLVKSNFGTAGVHFEYVYNDNSSLPAVLNYYYPGISFPLNNGLIAIDSFKYNAQGEMIHRGLTNLLFPQYNSIQTYKYSAGNVVKVSITSQNGGTVFNPGYTESVASNYDHKHNFTAGNPWLKYILFHSEIFPADYFRMFSKNNALDWTWGFDGGFNPISATYQYNDKGFANSISLHLFDTDGVTELITFTELSSSACDNSEERMQQPPSNRSFLLPKNLNKLPGTLPLTSR